LDSYLDLSFDSLTSSKYWMLVLYAVIRVVSLDITESVSSQIPGLRMIGIGVHAWAINNEGHILVCYLFAI